MKKLIVCFILFIFSFIVVCNPCYAVSNATASDEDSDYENSYTLVPFDKNKPQDIKLSWNGSSTLIGIYMENASISNEYYYVNANTVTLKQELFADLPNGYYFLMIEFDDWYAPVVIGIYSSTDTTVPNEVTNTEPKIFYGNAELMTTKDTFDLSNRLLITAVIKWNDAKKITDIKINGISLNPESYTIDGYTVTINTFYSRSKKDYTVSIIFDTGKPITFTVSNSVTIPDNIPVYPCIYPENVDFDKNATNQTNVNTTITLNDASSILGIERINGTITPADYSIKDNVLTIKKEYLMKETNPWVFIKIKFDKDYCAILLIQLIDSAQSNTQTDSIVSDSSNQIVTSETSPTSTVVVSEEDKSKETEFDLSKFHVSASKSTLYVGGDKDSSTHIVLDAPENVIISNSDEDATHNSGTNNSNTITAANPNVTVSYESSNVRVACVNSSGIITAKGVGNAVITTKIKCGTIVKTFQTKIKVLKPYIKITKTKPIMKIDETFTFKSTLFGLNRDNLVWSTTNKSILYIDKKTGKATAKSSGTVLVVAKCGNTVKKIMIKVR